jgi:WD40 repeat protein
LKITSDVPFPQRLASTCGGLELRVWDTTYGEDGVEPQEPAQVEVLAGSPDGRWLAGGGKDNKVYLWEADSGQLRDALEGQAGRVGALAFSPDSALLASASVTDGTVWLWDVNTREPVLVIPVAADACSVETLAFHPEGRLLAVGGIDWLATGGSDGAVCLWDIRERQLTVALNRGTTFLAFQPAGNQLAAASLRESVCVWDVATQELLYELTGHAEDVTCVAYSPDGQWLASGSDDRTIRIWNPATGELVAVQELDTPIKALRFSPDSRFLFTGNGNTTSYAIALENVR